MTGPALWGERKYSLYREDCRRVLPTFPDNSIDVVITDPPYRNITGGIVMSKRCGGVADPVETTTTVGDLWAASLDWCAEAWRIARRGVLVFAGHKDVELIRGAFPEAKTIALVTWYKRNSAPVLRNVPRYTTEFIWLLEKTPSLAWGNLDTTMLDIPMLQAGCFASERLCQPGTGKAVHPTQKPVALIRELLTINPDSVIDPFMGLGGTGVACASRDIPFVGIEIDQEYFNTATRRIVSAYEQPVLLPHSEISPQPAQSAMELPL